MAKFKLKGFNKVRKQRADGQVVEYHMIRGKSQSTFWRSDSMIRKGSAEYLDACRAMIRPAQPKDVETFDQVVVGFLKSRDFAGLAERTQRDYRIWCDRIRTKWGKAPKEVFNDPRIRKQVLRWRDQWTGKQADYAVTVLARVVSWAIDEAQELEVHHLQRIKRRYKSDRADVIWVPSQIDQFCAVAPEWTRRILITATETGLRPGDLIRLSWAHIEKTPAGRRIRIRTKKKNRIAVIPVTPAMSKILDATPKDRPLILLSERGHPLTEHRASEGVRQWKEKAGLSQAPRLYDARGTACTALLRAGLDLDSIALIMGWSLRYAANVIENYAAVVPDVSDEILVKLATARKG